jgi:hypothetical protein
MRSCSVYFHVSVYPLCLLKIVIVEREETTSIMPLKHMCDMMPESQSSAVREAPWRRPLLGKGLVIRSFNSQVSSHCD